VASCEFGLRFVAVVVALMLMASERTSLAGASPVLLYDGWTGDLSITAGSRQIDALIVTSDAELFSPRSAVFPAGSLDDSITPGRLTTAAGTRPLGDFDFGPLLPTALQARVVEADIRGLVRYPGQPTWEGIVVDLGNDLAAGQGAAGGIPEPAGVALIAALALLFQRRRIGSYSAVSAGGGPASSISPASSAPSKSIRN